MNRNGLWMWIVILVHLVILFFTLVSGNEAINKQASKLLMSITEPKLKIALPEDKLAFELSISRDGRLLAATFRDEVVIWDISNSQIIHKFPHKHFAGRMKFLSKSDFLAVRKGDNLELYKPGVWDQPYVILNFSSREENVGWKVMTFSEDEKWIALINWKNRKSFEPMAPVENWVSIYEVKTGHKTSEFARIPNDLISAIALSPDGRFLAMEEHDAKVKLWEVQRGQLIREFKLSPRADLPFLPLIYQITFSPNGKIIATANWDFTMRLLDMELGKELKILNFSNEMRRVSFSNDGKLLAGLGLLDFMIFNVKEQKIVCHYEGRFGPEPSLTFSPDGKFLALVESEPYKERFLTTEGNYAYKDAFKKYIAIYNVEKIIESYLRSKPRGN